MAGDLTDHLTTLVQEFLTRTASRARGPIDLRLELRESARLLLGEIRNASAVPSEFGQRALGHGIVALTYGRRPLRDGSRYIHSFAWWQPARPPPTADRRRAPSGPPGGTAPLARSSGPPPAGINRHSRLT